MSYKLLVSFFLFSECMPRYFDGLTTKNSNFVPGIHERSVIGWVPEGYRTTIECRFTVLPHHSDNYALQTITIMYFKF